MYAMSTRALRASRALPRPSSLPRPASLAPCRPFSATSSARATYRRFGSSDPQNGGSWRPSSSWIDPARWGTRQKVVIGAGALGGAYYVSNLEQVPETGRWRFIDVSPAFETRMAKEQLANLQQELGPRILPASHPLTKHVTRVVERILSANNLGSLAHASAAPAPASWSADPWGDDGGIAPGTAAGTEGREWHLLVVDDPKTVNAFASFGTIAVFTGILPVAKDEEGLAAVLAHEIGHVTARHNSEKVSQGKIGLAVVSLLSLVIGVDLGLSRMLNTFLMELPGDRRVELEADAIGLRLMSRACYRPEAALEMFTRMGEMEGGKRANVNFLYTHPTSETRVKALQALLPAARDIHAGSDCATTSSAFDAFRNAFGHEPRRVPVQIGGW